MDMQKLSKLMMLTTSDNDYEALASLRKANSLVSAGGKTWSDLLLSVTHKPSKDNTDDEFNVVLSVFEYCGEHITHQTTMDFLQSLERFYTKNGFLTFKQADALMFILERAEKTAIKNDECPFVHMDEFREYVYE